MNTIRAKYLLNGVCFHPVQISGFEGPAAKTDPNDGYGNPMVKGQVTTAFHVACIEKKTEKGIKYYDGECLVPDTEFNRAKLAVHILSGDFEVLNKDLEREIVQKHAPKDGERGSKTWKNPRIFGKPSQSTERERRAHAAALRNMDRASERGEAPPSGATIAAPSRKTKAQRTEANTRVQLDNAAGTAGAEAPKGAQEPLPETPDIETVPESPWPEESAKE